MKLVLNGVRMAFPQLWEPVQINAQGEPACSGSFLIDPKTQAHLMNATIECIKAVAQEKWGTQAQAMLTQLQAKGDLCLRDGATKAEYDGFEGMFYITGRNKARPTVLAAQAWNGKPIMVDASGNPFQINEQGIISPVTNLPFVVKAPYSGCYVNVSLDVWAQANQFGKRVNAKLLAVQFAKDGDAFSGGSGFDQGDFQYADSGVAGDFGAPAAAPAAGGFGFGAPAPAAAPSAGGFGFGAPAPAAAPSAGGFGFGAPAPAAAPAAGGFGFGAPAPAAAPAAGGFGFGSYNDPIPF